MDDLPAGFSVPDGRTNPWGTTHATLACRDLVKEPFGVINADDYYGRDSFKLLADCLNARMGSRGDHVLIGFSLNNTVSDHGTVSRGICGVGPDGHLTSVEECHHIRPVSGGIEVGRASGVEIMDGTQTVSMNMWGFTPDIFEQGMEGFARFLKGLENPLKGEYYLPLLVQDLIDGGLGTVDVVQSGETWLGVTYPEDKPMVAEGIRKLIQAGVYPEKLWA